MALGEFLYIESQVPGEQLSPGGKYRPFRFSNEHTREQEITRADKLFDQVLAIDPRHAEALTWKAAIRLDNGNYDAGEELVNQAMQINPDLPQLLELLSRVLDNTATLASYKAADLRTPKSWTQFGISYDIIWTRYPSQEELDRAGGLQDRANQLWANAEQSLSAAVQKLAGTADGFYYDGFLRQHQGDDQAALDDFQQAAKLDPKSNRNRQALIAALFKSGNEQEAAAEKGELDALASNDRDDAISQGVGRDRSHRMEECVRDDRIRAANRPGRPAHPRLSRRHRYRATSSKTPSIRSLSPWRWSRRA